MTRRTASFQLQAIRGAWRQKHQDICDRRVLNQRVRLYGDDIAAVVAENEVAAAQAARLVKVEYEEYEPIVTVKAAMAPEATPLHPDIRKDNVIVHSHMTMGQKDFTFEDGLKQAKEKYKEEDLVEINEVYDTPRISHCHIELPVSWAYVDVNGKVTIVSSTRSLILYAAVHHRPWVFLSVKSASSNHILAVDLEISRMCFMNR